MDFRGRKGPGDDDEDGEGIGEWEDEVIEDEFAEFIQTGNDNDREEKEGFRRKKNDEDDDRKKTDAFVGKDIVFSTGNTMAEMMEMLAGEEKLGMYRALKGEFATAARRYHMDAVEGHVPHNNPRISRPSSRFTVHANSETGMIVATGYTRLIADEHGAYVQFDQSHVPRDGSVVFSRASRTRLAVEYGWSVLTVNGTKLTVYYAGNSDDIILKDKPIGAPVPSANVISSSGNVEKKIERGQRSLSDFFTTTITPKQDTTKQDATKSTPKKPPSVVVTKKVGLTKHRAFERRCFYVNAADVYVIEEMPKKDNDNDITTKEPAHKKQKTSTTTTPGKGIATLLKHVH